MNRNEAYPATQLGDLQTHRRNLAGIQLRHTCQKLHALLQPKPEDTIDEITLHIARKTETHNSSSTSVACESTPLILVVTNRRLAVFVVSIQAKAIS